jgi:hypothetical protein
MWLEFGEVIDVTEFGDILPGQFISSAFWDEPEHIRIFFRYRLLIPPVFDVSP